MANRKAIVPQAELTRVLKAHLAAGIPITRTVITANGTITVHTVNDQHSDAPNPWDEA